MKRRSNLGITLVEMVVAITLLSLAAVTYTFVVRTMSKGKNDARDIAIGSMLIQACAEKVVAVRDADPNNGWTHLIGFNNSPYNGCTEWDNNTNYISNLTTEVEICQKDVTPCTNCTSSDTLCTVNISLQRGSQPFLSNAALSFDIAKL